MAMINNCQHRPNCPPSIAPDHARARIVAFHPEQGWWLLCNGVIVFDDGGELIAVADVHARVA